MQNKFDEVKMHGLSWVITLSFDSVDAAKDFLERENINHSIIEGTRNTIVRIED